MRQLMSGITIAFRRRFPHAKKWAMIGLAGLLLVVVFSYGVGVGRYRYAPYQRLAPIVQRFPEIKQFFVDRSAKLSESSLLAEEESHRAKNDRVRLVAQVSDATADTVLTAYAPFDINLDSPIGYTIGPAVRTGNSTDVFVHTTEPTSVEVFRLGRTKTSVESLENLSEQRQSSWFSGYIGFDWEPAFTLDTTGYRSGYYLIELTGIESGSKYQIPLIVTPQQAPRIALVSQTNTWRAYNNFGGLGNYTDTRPDLWGDDEDGSLNMALKAELPHIVHLPYARPYTYGPGNPEIPLSVTFLAPLNIADDTLPEDSFDGHLFRSEWPLAAFVEDRALDYGIYPDEELRVGGQILESEVIVFNTHSEYWSQEMFDALRQYLDNGGRVVFAGANSMYREVRQTEFGMRVISQFIPSYLTSPILGTSYTGDGFRTYGAYEVKSPDHWVFGGLGIEPGDTIGEYSANHPAARARGDGQVGASGFETDKVNRYSEQYAGGFQTLAVGTNSQGPAHMVFKETDSGGWIFHAASIAFTGALFHDPAIDGLIFNLLRPRE